MRFKTIVAPTDMSPESLDVVKYAAKWAKAEDAKLVVVHVVQTSAVIYSAFAAQVDTRNFDAELIGSATERLERWAKRSLKGVDRLELEVRLGLADEVICEVAEEKNASVVVMATHGRRGVSRALLGSVTEWVVRDAPCPVLSLRPPARKAKKPKRAPAGARKKAA